MITCGSGLPNNIDQRPVCLKRHLPDGTKPIQQVSVMCEQFSLEIHDVILVFDILLLDCVTRRLLIEEYESECKLKEIADSITRLHPRNVSNGILSKPRNVQATGDSDLTNQKQVCSMFILFY